MKEWAGSDFLRVGGDGGRGGLPRAGIVTGIACGAGAILAQAKARRCGIGQRVIFEIVLCGLWP